MGGRAGRPRGARGEHGQVMILFALALVALLGATAIAVDVGRFYSERRFLQNAADAAALAAANSLIRGESAADAEGEARNILSRNFLAAPNGIRPALPPSPPAYEPGHAGDPSFLLDGILISGGTVRVAIRNHVPYTLGQIVGLSTSEIGARARVDLQGNLLPIAVRQFVNAPGPNVGAPYPCTDNQTQFLDYFSTADTACRGTDADRSLRVEPNAGAPFNAANPDGDRTNHGPIVTILGQGAQPANGADFRGFIALDIRNFAYETSRVYYNGVTAGTQPNTLRAMEANWILTGGYPGPMFPPAVVPPDPANHVAIMSGNATGIAIGAVAARFRPGEEILVAVYPGIVMAIPDFALAPPAELALPPSGTTLSAGSLRVSRNQVFSGQVTLSTLADWNDPANPLTLGTLAGGTAAIGYNPNPVTPSLGSGATVNMANITTSGAVPGIYALWIKGQAGSPYLTTKLEPISVKIGTVTRSFDITSGSQAEAAANSGDTVVFNLTLLNAPTKNQAFGGPVALSLEGEAGPLPAAIGPIAFGATSVTPTQNGASTTLTINTGSLPAGRHRFVVRATGMNGDATPRPVTQLLPLSVDVTPAGSKNEGYIDVVGFSTMRIAAVNTNAITAYAITPVIPDMNDPRLRRGQVARLVPWN